MTDLPTGNYLPKGDLASTAREDVRPGLILRPFRIVSPGWKFLYIVAFIATSSLVSLLVGLIHLPWVALYLRNMVYLGAYAVGVRTFRGSNEDLLKPRALWRMTARPPAGFVIGALTLIGTIQSVVDWIIGRFEFSSTSLMSSLISLGLAYLYVASSIRLVRINRAATPAASA